MTANEFWQKFYKRYYQDNTLQSLDDSGASNNEGTWTPEMMRFLREMGKILGYQVSEEQSQAGGCRSDQRWVKDTGSMVCIEHETDATRRSKAK